MEKRTRRDSAQKSVPTAMDSISPTLKLSATLRAIYNLCRLFGRTSSGGLGPGWATMMGVKRSIAI